MARYRITETEDGRFLPEVHKSWWWPWLWEPICKDAYLVERWDYHGEKTYEEALENCRRYENRGRVPSKVHYFVFSQPDY